MNIVKQTHRKARKIARNLVQSRPMATQSDKKPTVFIVDDDAAIRFAMQALMDSVNLNHEIFESGDEFLEKITEQRPGCLVLDIRMPGLGGLELQEELIKRGNTLPIIFITGHGDVPMAVEAMQKGAVDFIQKPFRDQELLDRIREALATDEERREEQQQHAEVNQRLDRLTNREREVFDLVVTGKPNKVIAYELGVSQRTVEIHRARVMEKMQARSLADIGNRHMTARRPDVSGVPVSVLVELSANDSLLGVRVHHEASYLARQAALHAKAVVTPHESLHF